jgi:CBS domain containing-hemolysin-like protein
MIALYINLVVFLLGLNAFLALAEFPIVKIRPTRGDEVAEAGDRHADAIKYAQSHLNEYPQDLAFTPEGNLVVSDSHRIQVLSLAGAPLRIIE